MTELVKDVVSLESEAESTVLQAHNEAKQIEAGVGEEIVSYRKKHTEEMHQRIAEFRKNAEEAYRRALAKAEEDLKTALDALEHIPDDKLRKQTGLIVSLCKDL